MVPFCVRALMGQEKPKSHSYRYWGNGISAPPTDDPEESFRRHLVRRSEGCACCPQTFEFLRICVHRSSGAIVLLSTLTLAVFLIIYYWKTEVDENISNVQSSSNRREGIGRF